jgi:RecB family exonuclease
VNATDTDVAALVAKLVKLRDLIDHPATPSHEAAVALHRWLEINRRVIQVERSRRDCMHVRCIELDGCKVCTACEAVL